MVEYLRYNQDILLAESKNDLFNLFFALAIQAQKKNYDVKPLLNEMDRIAEVIKKLGIYSGKLVDMRMEEYRGYHFETEGAAYETPQAQDGEEEETQEERSEDCLVHILTYADTEQSVIEEMQELVQKYRDLPDMFSTDAQTFAIRKRITQIFYDTYLKAFMHTVKGEKELTPIVEMFLNFGFMDVQMAGEENANILFDLTEHLDVCKSDHVYTIFEWLRSVYDGRNEPSKNEFEIWIIRHILQRCARPARLRQSSRSILCPTGSSKSSLRFRTCSRPETVRPMASCPRSARFSGSMI